MLKAGIVGLPNVGKSTLFNALTASYQAESANYPFCTIEPNKGIVVVPDARLTKLAEMAQSKQTVPAVFEFVDIAGLVKGASKGAGLGNQFLAHIREVDAIVQVVRCFEDENVIHVEGNVNPVRDIEIIIMELALADAEMMERRFERVVKGRKSNIKEMVLEADALEKLLPMAQEGLIVDLSILDDKEREAVAQLQFLTSKPMLVAANIAEDELADPDKNPHVQALKAFTESKGMRLIPISVQIESELGALPAEEKQDYLESLGVQSSGVDSLIQSSYALLGLKTYLTVGPQEARAWPFEDGLNAQGCAGKIHSDISRGFIKAEVIAYDDFVKSGGEKQAKELGLMRQEGREYIMKDGDVVHFQFNV